MALRVSLIGPGKMDFYYKKLQNIEKEDLFRELNKIAISLSSSGVEIGLLPDKGISMEIAKLYRKNEGGKIVGFVPMGDNTFGIDHLQEYINYKFEDKKIFDKIINSGDWFKQDLITGLFGDIILYLGSSPGTDGELNYSTYLFNLFKKMNKPANKIHPEIRAGEQIPFTYLIYLPFFNNKKLSLETESYLREIGINFIYIDNPKSLKKELLELQKK